MGEKFNIGEFGHARFPQSKKGFNTTIDTYGYIRGADNKFVFFVDNDGYVYLAEKKDFKFEAYDFKDKLKNK